MTTPDRPDLNWPRAVAVLGTLAIAAATILGLAAIIAGVITHA